MNKAIANAALFLGLLAGVRMLEAPIFVALLVVPFMLYALLANRTYKHKIANSCVLVTGGSSGLGRALAHEAALRGAKQIILVARTESKLAATAKEIEAPIPIVIPSHLMPPPFWYLAVLTSLVVSL